MSTGPFRARLDGGVLTLVLDTPGSDVNVFDLRAAEQLSEAMATLDRSVEVVVLASGKPGSWVNGVGLMMAGAVRDPADVARLTAPVRAAYRALRDCRVPTVAAIRGSCFGCGVELALQCRHRVAVEDGPTRFYMTELADYLFVPCFGATQDLPARIGLDAAIRLLLDAERWSAREAAAAGLVDRSVRMQGADEAIALFVEDVRAGRAAAVRSPTRSDPALVDAAWTRIGAMPEACCEPWAAALALLEKGARGEAAYEEEIGAAGTTLVRPASKAAQGFFFVRHRAAKHDVRDLSRRARALVLAGLPRLGAALRRTAPAALAIVDAPAARHDDDRLLLASTPGPGVDAVVSTGPQPPGRDGERVAAWAPLLGAGAAFVEIDEGRRPQVAAALADALQRAGLETARTRPEGEMTTARVARALLDPIARFVAGGGAVADALRTARDLGLARSPAILACALGDERASGGEGAPADLRSARDGRSSPALADAIAASLVAEAHALVGTDVAHPATLDVLARHVADFPLAEQSLCRYASVARARALLDRASTETRALVDPRVFERMEEHAARGRDFYR